MREMREDFERKMREMREYLRVSEGKRTSISRRSASQAPGAQAHAQAHARYPRDRPSCPRAVTCNHEESQMSPVFSREHRRGLHVYLHQPPVAGAALAPAGALAATARARDLERSHERRRRAPGGASLLALVGLLPPKSRRWAPHLLPLGRRRRTSAHRHLLASTPARANHRAQA